VNRVPVDRGSVMVTDGFVQYGHDNVDMQGHSQQEIGLSTGGHGDFGSVVEEGDTQDETIRAN
jgi:hypothetical protein